MITMLPTYRLHRLAATFMVCSAAMPFTVNAIDSAGIITSALSGDCLEYRIAGLCYWLLCTPFGCTIKTSVKVRHYLPNAVVSAYNQTGDNPWTEMSLLGTGLPGIAEGGGANEQKRDVQKNNLRFKNVDVIGHPALVAPVFNQFMAQAGMSCSGSATALMPYFLSTLDAVMWRSGLPESLFPEALTPGVREIGSSLSGTMWGNVYPRSGFVTQADDYKAAAVTAQRAADVVTRSGQVHVYQPMIAQASPGYWPPDAVQENSGTRNHKWQRLTPESTLSCTVFPESDAPIATDGKYAWALWQPYSCCQRRGQTFLYSSSY